MACVSGSFPEAQDSESSGVCEDEVQTLASSTTAEVQTIPSKL